jgi:L-malate glycosyltransferase
MNYDVRAGSHSDEADGDVAHMQHNAGLTHAPATVPAHDPDPAAGVRVLVVTARTPPEFSGAGFAAYKYAIRLHSRGRLAFLLTRTAADVFRPGRSLSNDSTYRLPAEKVLRTMVKHPLLDYRKRPSPTRVAIYLWDVLQLLWDTSRTVVSRRDDYEIIHCFSPTWITAYAGLLGKLLGKKVVLEVTLLGSDDPASRYRLDFLGLRWRFKRLQFRVADAISTISPALSAVCIESGYPDEKVVIVPRSVDLTRFVPANRAEKLRLRQSLRLPESGPLLLYVGGLNRRKGGDLLMPIFERIRRGSPNASLVLLGPNAGPEGKELAKHIRETAAAIGAEKQVLIRDPTTSVRDYMQAADVFLFPSRREGFGTVIIEAMACGVPVIALKIPGITDFIIDSGRDSIIVPDEDPQAFASACLELVTDPRRYQCMGEAARERAAAFSDEVIDASYTKLYARVLGSDR